MVLVLSLFVEWWCQILGTTQSVGNVEQIQQYCSYILMIFS